MPKRKRSEKIQLIFWSGFFLILSIHIICSPPHLEGDILFENAPTYSLSAVLEKDKMYESIPLKFSAKVLNHFYINRLGGLYVVQDLTSTYKCVVFTKQLPFDDGSTVEIFGVLRVLASNSLMKLVFFKEKETRLIMNETTSIRSN